MPEDFTSDLHVTAKLSVPAWELTESFVRASGPGGQHVNKTSSAVQLRWSVLRSSLPGPVKTRFARRYSNRMTKEGELVIEVGEHRSQLRNRAAARERLVDMIKAVAEAPTRRRRTRPTAGSVRRRLASKKQRGEIKALRGKVERDD
ncbi:MAG: aminoacyl-tRNA hydrolase [Hyphomonadaceae bacterium]|nr:aminoacyl-tRNA hydrolase [Hyphomonadaceae bacterium]